MNLKIRTNYFTGNHLSFTTLKEFLNMNYIKDEIRLQLEQLNVSDFITIEAQYGEYKVERVEDNGLSEV